MSLNFASWNRLDWWLRRLTNCGGWRELDPTHQQNDTTSGIIRFPAMPWTVETLNASVDAELDKLPADMRARLIRILELIESVGLPNVKEPHVRHVRGPLWEIRLKGKAGIARALYITAREQRVVILRAFIKKTEKTPTSEIDLALQRANERKP